jgi:hypothetical protein
VHLKQKFVSSTPGHSRLWVSLYFSFPRALSLSLSLFVNVICKSVVGKEGTHTPRGHICRMLRQTRRNLLSRLFAVHMVHAWEHGNVDFQQITRELGVIQKVVSVWDTEAKAGSCRPAKQVWKRKMLVEFLQDKTSRRSSFCITYKKQTVIR